ncbi:phosphate acetyltransferase [Niveibacterium sp. SC-1]|uniref:phosphate acetyltransferase n=1 Tax=Niveibacterium sp. SC-1 TaxID=3135646 RepID=UPI0031200A10
MQIFFVAPCRQSVGLTSVALGMVRGFQQLGLNVRFVKPIAQADPNPSVHFLRNICQLDAPEPLSMEYVENRITAGETDELLEEIVSLSLGAAGDADVLLIEGLQADPARPFIPRLCIDIVRSMQASVVLVASGEEARGAGQARKMIAQIANNGARVVGVVFNKVAADFNREQAAVELAGTPVWGYVPHDPELLAPRALDIARHMNAEIVVEGELATRRVLDTVSAARAVAEVIPRLIPGALIICAGDRDDVMLAVALAESSGVKLAGLLLTHDSWINGNILKLGALALNGDLPILRTKGDSYGTATQVSRLSSAVPLDDLERMNLVLESVAEALDEKAMTAGIAVPLSTKLSPPAFRYQLIQKARAANKRIVLPEGEEPRTIKAAVICQQKGIARCVLLGKRAKIEAVAAAQGVTLPPELEILDPDLTSPDYVAPMVELRKSKGLTEIQATRQLEDTVVLGTMMLAVDHVDGLVSGAIHTTANTVRPALQLIKTAPGSSIVSSCFFMLMPDQVLVYADCAINPDPTAEQLAEIAKQSADSARAFGVDPKVAMISYSTGSSGAGDDVEKVRQAAELAHSNFPDLVLDGPLQYDAASVVEVGAQKAPGSAVAGQATVFVFPDLNTGNTTYKAVQRSANVVSVGPMLQGLRKPVNDLSRGALVDDIVFTIALTAIQADAQAR